jgi:hypothetical protein
VGCFALIIIKESMALTHLLWSAWFHVFLTSISGWIQGIVHVKMKEAIPTVSKYGSKLIKSNLLENSLRYAMIQ